MVRIGRKTAIGGVTAALLVGGGVAYAATTGAVATCTASPAVTKTATAQSFNVSCSVPLPPPVTVTRTVTQTVTRTVTGPAPAPSTTTGTPRATTTATSTTTPTTTPTSSTCPSKWTSSASNGSWTDAGHLVNNNMWNSAAGPQTISACSWQQWSITSNQPGTGSDDSVKTYADTQTHVSHPLSGLSTLPSSFDVTTPAGGGTVPASGKQWNAAYDLWLDNYGTEVMIWNNWTMNWQYWYQQYGGVQVTIDGVAYHAYRNSAGTGLWFIRDQVTNTGSVDIAHVLQWAVSKGWLRSSQVLGEVEYGFEVAYTGAPTVFTLNKYTL